MPRTSNIDFSEMVSMVMVEPWNWIAKNDPATSVRSSIFDGSKLPGHANEATDEQGPGFCRFEAMLLEDIWGIMCVYPWRDLKMLAGY